MFESSFADSKAVPSLGSAHKKSAAPSVTETPDTEGSSVRVLCVDDHAVLIQGLKAQFAIDGRFQIVGSLSTSDKLMEEVQRLNPELVLLDIEIPGPDIFEMADRLHHAHPKLRFVFLSAHIRDGYLAAAYKCGACGYFAKADSLQDIVEGLKQVVRSTGTTFVMGPKMRERCDLVRNTRGSLAGDGDAPPASPLESLTPREIEVLRLIGRGMTRTQIASELCRSAKTVDGHQERIMKKLGIDARTDLIRFAIREGLAEA